MVYIYIHLVAGSRCRLFFLFYWVPPYAVERPTTKLLRKSFPDNQLPSKSFEGCRRPLLHKKQKDQDYNSDEEPSENLNDDNRKGGWKGVDRREYDCHSEKVESIFANDFRAIKRMETINAFITKDGCNKLQWYINTSKPWNNNKKYCRVHVNGHAFTLNHSSSPNRKRRSKPIDIVSFFNNTFPVHTQLVRRSNGRKTADIHIRAARIYVEYLILTIPCFNTVLGIVLQ